MRNPKTKGGRLIRRLKLNIRRNKKTFILYSVLRVLVILAMIRSLLIGNYEGVMLCLLSLALFLLPSFVMQRFRVQIPPLFEGLIYIFIFASEILGELDHYFVRVPGWDTMLHTVNGFLCAAVGFSLVYLLNRHSRDIRLSPLYLALVAFCFSMTIGVLWEFFECAMDQFFREDMQKDFILRAFTSVTLDPDGVGNKVRVADITRTVIQTASGRDYVIEGGYLDVGLLDTMKDLFVNFIGAAVFSVIGYFYALRGDDRSKRRSIARDLMLTPKDDGQ
ncbi:MAG: hypothetical protein II028_05330 [Clostridia bacterium]|nr:hypothetical protein [Clostridia bacterium]